MRAVARAPFARGADGRRPRRPRARDGATTTTTTPTTTAARRANGARQQSARLNASLSSDADASTGADVFVASVPLEGFELASDFFFPGGVPTQFEHRMVLVRYAGDANTTLYDFLPAEPKSPKTAATLLSGGSVRGVVRTRRIAGLPGRKCAFVAKTRGGLGYGRVGVEAAVAAFHERFDTNLRLRTNDCHTHVRELTQWLTCEFGEVIGVDEFGNMRVMRKGARARVDEEEEEEEDDDASASASASAFEPSSKGEEKVKKKSSGSGKKNSGKK